MDLIQSSLPLSSPLWLNLIYWKRKGSFGEPLSSLKFEMLNEWAHLVSCALNAPLFLLFPHHCNRGSGTFSTHNMPSLSDVPLLVCRSMIYGTSSTLSLLWNYSTSTISMKSIALAGAFTSHAHEE